MLTKIIHNSQHSACASQAEIFRAHIQEILLSIDLYLFEIEVLARNAVLRDT